MVTGTCNDCRVLSNGTWQVSGSTTPIYIDVVNGNNQSLAECVNVTTQVFRTYPELVVLDDCGCPINSCDEASLRINISKRSPQTVDCGFKGFTLDETGLIEFEMYDNSNTFFMNSECCASLGFTPEIQNGIYVCRWREEEEDCSNYTSLNTVTNEGYELFIGPNGAQTIEVPQAECCNPIYGPELLGNGKYRCNRAIPPKPAALTPVGVSSSNYIIWDNGTSQTTQYIDDKELCYLYNAVPISEVYGYRCQLTCQVYSDIKYGTDGLATFYRQDESFFTVVPLVQCCPSNTIAHPIVGTNGFTQYKCYAR